MNLSDIRSKYMDEGANYLDANSRTSHDVLLALIAKSPFVKNITIKGGVLMRHISGDSRRATQDLDLDFIRYSLNDDSIRAFIEKLDEQSGDISIAITAPIEKLKHQDYNGKRIHLRIADDYGVNIDTKLDIGVHKNIDLKQNDYCFDLSGLDYSVNLLVNTKEQIFVEKLKALLRLGVLSTRYKDIFDMYYLATQGEIVIEKLHANLKAIIFDDTSTRENNMSDIVSRLNQILHDPRFTKPLNKSKRHNWIDADFEQVVQGLLSLFKR